MSRLPGRGSGRNRRWGWAIAATALILVLPGAAPQAHASPPGVLTSATTHLAKSSGATNFQYNSSVDGFPLSYAEKLPTGYTASKAYPLLVYLHGEGANSTWIRGGAGSGLANYLTDPSLSGKTLRELMLNASTFGVIVMAPSPRTVTGFYTNSPCGGPQEKDTLDAIAHEQAMRNVSSIYLLGFSMGSLGALSLAGHHPGTFRGVAVTGTVSDIYQRFAYMPTPASGVLDMTCGARPSVGNASVGQLFTYLSVLRFHPQNFSGLRLWTGDGAKDHGAPDNASLWGFYQVNNTFLNSTCFVATSLGEPSNCTTTIRSLHLLSPALYPYRLVYEPLATHLLAELSPSDMFRYLFGLETGGCYVSSFPPTTFSSCP